MDIRDFQSGTYQNGFQYQYFLPNKINHGFTWSEEILNELLEKASIKIGELNSFSSLIPDIDIFIRMHTAKEATLSSRIEGTQTNIEDTLLEEADIDPEKRDDWEEVNNYILAMNTAIGELKNLPLSNRLLRKTHQILLSSVRGKHKNPGEFRQSQNWIGGATLTDAVFIPPAHTELPELLSDWEQFLNNTPIHVPHLIKIAIAHYQFETIHPFLDGNGRIGRLLITLYLVANGILEKPLLYLSDFFEKNKTLYYDNLTFVRSKNDLAQWIKFFLIGVIQTAEKSAQTLKQIIEIKTRIENDSIIRMGKRILKARDLFYKLFSKPVVTGKDVQSMTGLSPKSANELIKVFIEQNILVENSEYRRNRIFVFKEYIRCFK